MTTRQRWTLIAAITGSALVFLDATVVTVALPRIGQALPTPRIGVLEAQAYIYNTYLLSLGALLIVGGRLADIHGRRRTYVAGLVAFGIASLACGLAVSMEMLLVARLLKGAAAAVVVPGALAILTAEFEGEARGHAFGIWAGASAMTTILGPVVGGVLVDAVSWRAVFLLNLPLVALAAAAARRHVAETRDESVPPQIDWRGALVAVVALGGLTFGAMRGQERLWQDPTAFVAITVGVAAAILFVPLMARTAAPLVPLSLFRSRNFLFTNLATVPIYGCLYVTMYFLVLHLQGTLAYNAAASGLATVPMVLFLAVMSTRIGVLAARHGSRWFMTAGPVLMGAGTLYLARVPSWGPPWVVDLTHPASLLPPPGYLAGVLPALGLFGLGVMVVVAPLTTALMNSVEPERAGIASAVNNALSRVGPQLTTAVLFVAVTAAFHTGLADRVDGFDASSPSDRGRFAPLNPPEAGASPLEVDASREASGDAFRLSMLAATALAWTGALVSATGIRDAVTAGPCEPGPPCMPGAVPPAATGTGTTGSGADGPAAGPGP